MSTDSVGSEVKAVWLKVDDNDEWVPCKCTFGGGGGRIKLTRQYAPQGVQKDVTLGEEEVAKLRPAVGDLTAYSSDLVWLEDVHDSTMLHNLRLRYGDDRIYTAIGPVLLAINPYKKIDKPRGTEVSLNMEVEEPPHCNRTAGAAYAGLLEGSPQSVLISGESGAGKTETNKLCMACLADISNSKGAKTTEQSLQAGILLEAFGNARTVHNNNSSRFGKWCAVYFDNAGRMAATQIKSYLLEKSRVVGPTKGERNYHIFYQLVAGATAEERTAWSLLPKLADYRYLQGEASAPGIDDSAEWTSNRAMLANLGYAPAAQSQLFTLYAAVLALGNTEFVASGPKGDAFSPKDGARLEQLAALLQVPAPMLRARLTSRVISTASSSYTVPLTQEGCADTRDALAKAVYLGLFDGLIRRLNVALGADKISPTDDRYIGLLDIFGFENFAINSFEQLCINFTNEKLQQHFMDALIKREQAEYSREGVKCEHIAFPDNSKQIELIDHKSRGVFAFLDEECNVPKGTDANYATKMHAAFASSPHYEKPKFGAAALGKDLGEAMAKTQFVLHHYAEQVLYTAHGWLEKNRGTLHPDLTALMASSESPGLQDIFTAAPEQLATGKKQTVGGAFRASLRALSATMLQTTQHFIRCVKPNAEKRPDAFHGTFVARQLRYTGVHSVVDIHRAGYPIKFAFADFVKRYRCIAFDQPKLIAPGVPEQTVCLSLLDVAHAAARADAKSGEAGEAPWVQSMRVQMGKTRVFMRGDVVRHLEKPRHAARGRAACSVQRYARARLLRRIATMARAHLAYYKRVRAALDGDRNTQGRAAATVQRRLDEGGTLLDELTAAWEAAQLPPAADASGMLGELHAQLSELEVEIRDKQAALLGERKALEELQAVVASTTGSTKQAFVALKAAVAQAAEASRGLTEELEEAMEAVEADLTARFADMISEDNEELRAILAAREEKRRAAAAEAEARMLGAADVETREIPLRNGKDAKGKPLLGYTLEPMVAGGAPGVQFDAANSVTQMTREGAAAKDNLLRVGDVVLKVDGEPLNGQKVTAALDARAQATSMLTVARRTVEVGAASDTASLPKGERAGWMYLTKATDNGNTGLHAPKKCWAVLKGELLTFHEEVVRGQERVPHPQPLKGALIKVPMSKKLKINRVNQFDTQHQKLVKGDKKALGKQEYENYRRSSLVEQQKSLATSVIEQTPTVTVFLQRQLAPFRMLWPDGEQGNEEAVCAVATNEERQEWVRVLQAKVDAINSNAPTSGWLEKRKGRGGGLVSLTRVLGWDKRWFVLTQPTAPGEEARFEYFDRPGMPVSKGMVAVNSQATLLVSEKFKADNPFGFCITSQGADDKRPVTTVLAAAKGAELDKWTAALKRAIHGERGLATLAKRTKEEEALLKKGPEKLIQLLDYMGHTGHKGVTEVPLLVQMIMQARSAGATSAGGGAPQSSRPGGGGAAAPTKAVELRDRMEAEEARLRKRTVDELHALLEYMEVEVDPELDDKEALVQLVVKQKSLQAVAQTHAPALRKWLQKSASKVEVAPPPTTPL